MSTSALQLFVNPLGSLLVTTGTMVLTALAYFGYLNEYSRSWTWRDLQAEEVYDFIVVGGGSSGSVVVNRLSKSYTVLLLELGGDPSIVTNIGPFGIGLINIPGHSLMTKTVPQNNCALASHNNVVFWNRGLGLGGSSNINGMIYQRGNRNDYDNWANITGNPEWKYENVLPIFKRLEDYHGVHPNEKFHSTGGPIHIEKVRQTYMSNYFFEAAKEKGYKIRDQSSYQAEGFNEMEVNMKNGLRWGTFQGYIKSILDRKNFRTYRYSRVVKVHLDESNHAYGVTYYRFGQKRFVRARKEIILSAGAVDTPKILMLSGIGPKDHLESLGIKCQVDLPVGKNLQDHLSTLVGPFLVDTPESVIPSRMLRLNTLTEFLNDRRGILASNGCSGMGFVTTEVRNDKNWPEIQYTLNPVGLTSSFPGMLARVTNLKFDILDKSWAPFYGHDANIIVQTLGRPKSRGEITLASSDPLEDPIIQPNYFSHEDDMKAMVQGVKKLVDLYENTTTYKAINARLIPIPFHGCEAFKLKSDEYYECVIRHLTMTIYHPVGTAAMGKDSNDPRAVVDSELRVLKTTGLRVIDASILPTITNANTNIPCIMIGEMGSSFILRHWTEQNQISRRKKRWSGSIDNEKCAQSRYVMDV